MAITKGMVVKKDKKLYVVVGKMNTQFFICLGSNGLSSAYKEEVLEPTDLDTSTFDIISTIDMLKCWEEKMKVKKHTITEGERQFLSFVDPDAYVCRNESGLILLCADEPEKMEHHWKAPSVFCQLREDVWLPLRFEAVNWNDEKPWVVSDLMALEVKR